MMAETDCCEYLCDDSPPLCRALENPYIPDASRMAEYCRSSNHRICPFHMYWRFRNTHLIRKGWGADEPGRGT